MKPQLLHGGKLVETARQAAGLTQLQLAKKAGKKHQQDVSRVERSENPEWQNVVRLLHAAGFALRIEAQPTKTTEPTTK